MGQKMLIVYQLGAILFGSIGISVVVCFIVQHIGVKLHNRLNSLYPWDVDYSKSHILSQGGYWLCWVKKACFLVLVVVLWPLWLGFIIIRLAIGVGGLIK